MGKHSKYVLYEEFMWNKDQNTWPKTTNGHNRKEVVKLI